MPHERLTLIPRTAQPVMPWRNGGGSTREVARATADGVPDGFRWRVSIARIESDGPFSHFPGFDRTLWLLSGAGMELLIDGVRAQLTEPLAGVSFAGEATVSARLLGGPTDDLNLMVDRARAGAAAEFVRCPDDTPQTWCTDGGGTDLLLVLGGSVDARSPTGKHTRLALGDALRLDDARGPRQWTLRASGAAAVFVATLR